MPINASNVKAPARKRVEQDALEIGTYPCRLVGVVDKGLQPIEEWDSATKSYVVNPEKRPQRKIMVTYEFGTEFLKDAEGDDDGTKPRWLSETFNLLPLTSDLATSTKRAKAIDPKLELGGDWLAMVGMPCNVMVAHKPNGKEKIGDVSPIMKGMHYADLVNEPRVFDLEEPNLEVFNSLPEWLQNDIKGNLEYKGSALDKLLSGDSPAATQEKTAEAAPVQEEEDEDGEW